MSRFALAAIVALVFPSLLRADLITYGFAFTSDNNSATSVSGSVDPLFTIGAFTIGNSLGTVSVPNTTGSPSSGYVGVSGTNNFGNAFKVGSLSVLTSGYLEVAVTNSSSATITLNDFDFGTRSTSTGPQAYALRSSADGFATDILTGAIANDSQWSFKNNSFASYSIGAGTSTFRLFGYGGSGSPNNNQITGRFDDFAITFNIQAVPEPSSIALIGLTVCGSLMIRRCKSASRA